MSLLPVRRKNQELSNTTSEIDGKVLFKIRFKQGGRKEAFVGDYELKSIERINYNPRLQLIFESGQEINIEQNNISCAQAMWLDPWQANVLIDADKKELGR